MLTSATAISGGSRRLPRSRPAALAAMRARKAEVIESPGAFWFYADRLMRCPLAGNPGSYQFKALAATAHRIARRSISSSE
jgi:hypothetical protein